MRSFAFFAVLLALWAAAGPAFADSCGCTEAPLEDRLRQADAVFAGTVTDIEVVKRYAARGVEDLPVVVTLRVDEAYQGARDRAFTLHTSLTRRTCMGYPFEKGAQYLIFAYQRKDSVYEPASLYSFPSGTYDTAGLCGGTKPFTGAGEDLKTLRPQPQAKRKLLPGVLAR